MLEIPDVRIEGDSGATVAGCASCAESACESQVSACNVQCACSGAAGAALHCLAEARAAVSCFLPLGEVFEAGSGPAASALLECVTSDCGAPCGFAAF